MNYGLLLLAGGFSRRFRSDKRLASINGKPMLLATLDVVQDALEEFPGTTLKVVIRARDPLVEHLLAQRGVAVVHAPGWPIGIGASIAAGAAALLEGEPALDVIAVVPADLPQLRPETLRELLQQCWRDRLTVPACLGEPGELVAIGADFFSLLPTLSVRHGLKKLLRRHAGAVRYQTVSDTSIIRSINSPADFQAAIQLGPADRSPAIHHTEPHDSVAAHGE
ncbi:nucleotidyltransferase family protein [Microbulbifer guangxiensis]|uniref:nucleotidyltransferase family protein n=1 Tax=Microbulbifer guangxiensis TaxID=2904249 RepID=UPI001F36AB87|nr:NTP transferase domain-containing protein [Microbulbifer guangxiensis]